jgi:lysophospholipase L1-like esterase
MLLGTLLLGGANAQAAPQWSSAWTAPQGIRLTTPEVTGNTVRMVVRPTLAGASVRVKLENTLGQSPVVFSSAYFGEVAGGADLVPGSNRQLTFDGQTGLELPAGAGAWSDPLDYPVAAFSRYAISLDVVSASDVSAHALGLVTNFMAPGPRAAQSDGGGFAAVPDLNPGTPAGAAFPFYWVSALDVLTPDASGTIVALGDSITDGRCSTKENHGSSDGAVVPDRYQRWTDLLAQRLMALPADHWKAVANEGIAGNRVVTDTETSGVSALARMDRDVLERAGATHVIFFEGTNDIAGGADASSVIAGMQQVIDRAHAAGLKILGVTTVPRGSATGWTAAMEQQRLAVNAWMRGEANFDGLIDFAEVLRGPVVPSNGAEQIAPAYSCFDGIHPNDEGYAAMGAAIDLSLFGD